MNILMNWLLAFAIFISGNAVMAPHSSATVRLGDEQLLVAPNLALIQGKKIGILAHYASRTSDGKSIVDVLAARKDIQLKMIFSPEHGFRTIDDSAVQDTVDPQTGLPIYSLYGPRKAPTADMLAQIDVVLIDLQDVGLRYYTYPATVVYTLQAAKAANKPVLILDRPNPLGGSVIEGATLDADLADEDLTTIAQMPTRYAMTLGETALFLNQELKIGADVQVVSMQGWSRAMHWDDTGLKWWSSSPALVQTDQIFLYAILGTLEATNISVGRGVDNALAFRNYGAPWVTAAQAQKIVSALSGANALPGVKFSYVEWTPDRSEFLGKLCRGFRLEITDLTKIDSFRILIEVSKIMQQVLGNPLQFSKTLSMLGSSAIETAILNNLSTDKILEQAASTNADFLKLRAQILLY
jgi:uncharacterized protein YbbC (DUF1343 family)